MRSRNPLTRIDWSSAGDLRVIRGGTGVGKTDILRVIANRGIDIIDLEQLAGHAGSAFGGLGRGPQPSHRQFQLRVASCWTQRERGRPIFCEHEGPYLGSVGLPPGFHEEMSTSPGILLRTGKERRIDHILARYRHITDDALIAATGKLRRRLGEENHQAVVVSLKNGNRRNAVEALLNYYDRSYDFQIKQCKGPIVLDIDVGERSFAEVAEIILSELKVCRMP